MYPFNPLSATFNLQLVTISNSAASPKNKKEDKIFHDDRPLADNSHEISCLISFENEERCHKICCLLQS